MPPPLHLALLPLTHAWPVLFRLRAAVVADFLLQMVLPVSWPWPVHALPLLLAALWPSRQLLDVLQTGAGGLAFSISKTAAWLWVPPCFEPDKDALRGFYLLSGILIHGILPAGDLSLRWHCFAGALWSLICIARCSRQPLLQRLAAPLL